MEIKRIIVYEIPGGRGVNKVLADVVIIFTVGNTISQATKRNCVVEVEEVCEWVWEEYEMCISPHNNGNWCDKDEYQFCPTCGKRIKYVEVE